MQVKTWFGRKHWIMSDKTLTKLRSTMSGYNEFVLGLDKLHICVITRDTAIRFGIIERRV